MGFLSKLFGGGSRSSGGGLVKCPHCKTSFKNTAADNPVDALIHGMLSQTGESNTSAVSKNLGLAPTDFDCPKCGRSFTL
jgi:uncharacterized C2H2 Zn-finger protein